MRCARWRHDGKALYYVAPDVKLIAAEVKELNGSLRTLFQTKTTWSRDSYDVSTDATRFVVYTIATDEGPAPLCLVLNWTSELKK